MSQQKNSQLPNAGPVHAWREIVGLALLGFAYWVFMRIGLLLVAQPEGIASIWPVSGLALAVLILRSKKEWPALLAVIFVANILGNWSGGNSLSVSLGFALVNTLEPAVCAWIMISICKPKITFERDIDVFGLVAAAVLGNGLTALLGASIPALAYGASFVDAWKVWWVADGLGMMLVTPLIISLSNYHGLKHFSVLRQLIESGLLILALVLFTWLVFGPFTLAEEPLLRTYMFFPFLIWLAFRFSPRGMTQALFLVATVAILGTLHGTGIFAFANSSQAERLIAVQMFLSVLAFSGLLISAIVAERKLKIEKLQAAEVNYRTIFENAPVGFFQSSSFGRYISVNPMMAKIYGFGSPAEMIDGITDIATQIYVEPTGREEFRRLITEQEQVFEFVQKNRRKDGSIICTTTNARVVKDAKGDVLYYEGFLKDITEIKEAEKAVRESRELAQSTLDSLAAHVCVLDEDGTILTVNKAWLDFAAANPPVTQNIGVGANYLAVCDAASGPGSELAHEFASGIRAVASGALEVFKQDYACHSPDEQRWFVARVRRFAGGESRKVVIAHENITERMLTEDALRKSEARFRAVVENNNDGILFGDVNAVISYRSPSYVRINGFSDDERLGHSGFETVHPDDQEMLRQYWAQLIDNPNEAKKIEYRIRHKNGSWLWIESTGQNLLNNPDIQQIVVTSRDITERKQAENALRESEKDFRILFNTMTEGVALNEIVYDENGEMVDYRILNVNTAFYATADYDRAQVVGNTATKLYGMTSELIKEFWLEHTKKNSTAYAEMLSPLNQRWFFVATSPFVDNKFVTSFLDITERKHAEDALRKREQEFMTLVENSPDMIVRFDPSFRYLYCNSAVERQIGRPPSALLGKTPLETGGPREQAEFVIKSLAQALETGQEQEVEQRYPALLGMKYFQTRIVPERNKQGKIESLLAITRDVTERKKMQDELQKSNTSLARAQEIAHIGSWEDYLPTGELHWSDEMCRIMGFQPGTSITLADAVKCFPPDELARFQQALKAAMEENAPYSMDYKIIRPDKEERFIHDEGVILRDGTGQAIWMFGATQDITERKLAEAGLLSRTREAETLRQAASSLTSSLDLNQVLDNLLNQLAQVVPYDSATVFLADEGHLRVVAGRGLPHLQDILGQVFPSDNELFLETQRTGRPLILVDAQQDPRFDKWGGADYIHGWMGIPLIVGGEVVGRLTIDSRTANIYSEKHAELALAFANQAAIALHNARLYQQSQQELGERKRAEDALRASEERYRRLTGAITDYIYTVRVKNGKAVETSHGPGCVAVTGYTAEEFKADPYLWYQMIWPDDRGLMQDEIQNLLTGHDVSPREHRIIRKDGQMRWIRDTLSPHFNEKHELVSYDGLIQDITERKLAEDALQESEEHYRRIIDTAYEGIWVVDDAYRTTFVNARMEEMLGYSSAELLGKRVDAFLYETGSVDAQQINQHLHRIGGQQERRFKRKDGSELWTLVSAKPILNDQNVFKGSFAMFSDITERKQADAALQKFSFMANTAPEFMSLVNRQYVYESVNDAYCNARGKPRSEFIGRPLADVWGEALYREKLLPYLEQCFSGEIVRYEQIFAFSGTSLRTYRVGMYPYRNMPGAQVTHVVVVTSDITEYKQAEAALRQLALNLKKAQHFAHLGSWTWDIKNNHVDWSDEMYQIFDVDRETFTGSLPDIISKAIHPDDRAKVDASNLSVITEGKPVPLDYRIVRKDGSIRTVWAEAGELVRDETGQPSFLSGTVQDITERKQMEENLRASLAEKEALLKEVHHRVKNNLQIISSLLNMQASNSQNEQVIHALDESQHRVKAMALIHEKLYQSKNLEYIQAEEYISELVDHLLSSFAGQIQNVSFDLQIAKLTLDINKAIPCGMIISELVSNALKYAFPAKRGGLVKICLDSEDGKVHLVISDNGVGLPADVDVHHPETLGLELVSVLSHQLKASLEVTRHFGTTFTLIFKV